MNHPTTLWAAFEAAAAQRGESPALLMEGLELSFRQLKVLAMRAAALMRAHGVEKRDVVVLQRGKSVETYALMLGALRLGGVYACIDPKNPSLRTQAILERLRPRLMFSDVDARNPFGSLVNDTDAQWRAEAWPDPISVANEDARPVGDEPAYVMFTSGSTGEPKGAAVAHQGVLMLMRWASELFKELAEQRFSALNPIHFDNSVFDFYCGLVNGAALVPVETGKLNNPADWVKELRRQRANVVFAVPTLFLFLDRMGLLTPEALPDVRFFLFGGEGFPIHKLRAFEEKFAGSARLINVYGPTETSCICSSVEVTAKTVAMAGEGFHSLGRMHPNFSHSILDEEGKTVAAGQTGELWIGGPAVGLGYYGDPVQSAARFRQDPRQDQYRSIFYRTGDLVSAGSDGALWFRGRADNQVKIAGHRIELEEIDFAVQSVEGVRRAAAVHLIAEGGGELVVCFQADRSISNGELVAIMSKRLPAYMRPTRYLQLADLPTNANGKVDRMCLVGYARNATFPQETASAAIRDLEDQVRAAWREVLSIDEISLTANFFDLGGTSIKAGRVLILLERRLGARLTLVDFFSHPTVAGFAVHISGSAITASNAPDEGSEHARAAQRRSALAGYNAARSKPPSS